MILLCHYQVVPDSESYVNSLAWSIITMAVLVAITHFIIPVHEDYKWLATLSNQCSGSMYKALGAFITSTSF